MNGIGVSAFLDELVKIARETDPNNPWAPKTIGSPRSKLSNTAFPKAPTAPGPMSPKLVLPAAKYTPNQSYSQPTNSLPTVNPGQGVEARTTPPPNV